ncbi:MAG TPA: T9SS type A sorting domain-containing protein, partial [Bacteroidia bacterium]
CFNSCATTSIAQFANSNEVSLYPNPAKDVLNVECLMVNETTLQITDMLGNIVMQHTYSPPSEGQGEAINVADLAEGIYNISISSNEGVVNKRVVIVR